MNFAGQPAARLNRQQAVYDTTPQRSLLITIFSPALFFAPDVHLRKLELVFVDDMVNQVPWKAFINQLQEEWREFILYVCDYPSSETTCPWLIVSDGPHSPQSCVRMSSESAPVRH